LIYIHRKENSPFNGSRKTHAERTPLWGLILKGATSRLSNGSLQFQSLP
jgi:hypothetical protein